MGWLANYRFSPELALRVWQREVDVYKKIYRSTILGGLADPVIYLLAMGLGLGDYVSLQGRVSRASRTSSSSPPGSWRAAR